MTDPACIKCGIFAARLCRTCGPLCIAHTCEHLRTEFEVIEVPLEEDEDNSPSYLQSYSQYLKSFLSDEAMVASMTDEMLRTALTRYKEIVRFIENEIASRSSGARKRYVRLSPAPSRQGARSLPTKRKKKERSPAERLLDALRRGYITKEVVEAFLAKGNSADEKQKEKEKNEPIDK